MIIISSMLISIIIHNNSIITIMWRCPNSVSCIVFSFCDAVMIDLPSLGVLSGLQVLELVG